MSYYKLQKILLETKKLCKEKGKDNDVIKLLTIDDIQRFVGDFGNLLSHNIYQEIIHEMMSISRQSYDYKEGRILNPMLSACVLGSIYNGIYSPDMSALDNLRAMDINESENSIIVRPNNAEPYTLQVEEWLAKFLYELAFESKQRRKRKNGIVWEDVDGKYSDSCFKFTFKSQPDWDNLTKVSCVMRYDRLLKPLTKFSFLNIFSLTG